MSRAQASSLSRPVFGYVVCLVAFAVFQGLLVGLQPIAHREFAAENIDSALAAFLDPAFTQTRIWLVVALGFALLTTWWGDFGTKKPEAQCARCLLAAGCFLLVLVRALQFPYDVDDSYIDFRHARNLVLHGSLDYNIGDPAMGFTSHLHLWILSLAGAIGGFKALPIWSQNLNILFDLGSFVLVFALGRRLGLRPLSAALGSYWLALSLYQINFAVSGKESSLLVLLLLWLLYALERRQTTAVAWAATLIFLTRPEGVLVAGLTGGWCLYQFGPRSLKSWIVPGLLAVGWYAILWFHFGTVMPQGMVAKSVVYPCLPSTTLLWILSFWSSSFGQGTTGVVTLQNLATLCLIVPLTVWAFWRWESLRMYLGFIGLLTAAFVAKHVSMFPWYFSWFALVPVLVIPFYFQKALDWVAQPGPLRWVLLAGFSACVALLPFDGYKHSESKVLGFKIPYPIFNWSEGWDRLLLYERAAHQIQEQAGTSAYVAISEDGVFGYAYEGRVLTLDGLAYLPIKRYYPLPPGMFVKYFAISPRMVQDESPDYVVFFDALAQKSLLPDPSFQQQYVPVSKTPATAFGSEYFYIYQKQPANGGKPPLPPAN